MKKMLNEIIQLTLEVARIKKEKGTDLAPTFRQDEMNKCAREK